MGGDHISAGNLDDAGYTISAGNLDGEGDPILSGNQMWDPKSAVKLDGGIPYFQETSMGGSHISKKPRWGGGGGSHICRKPSWGGPIPTGNQM